MNVGNVDVTARVSHAPDASESGWTKTTGSLRELHVLNSRAGRRSPLRDEHSCTFCVILSAKPGHTSMAQLSVIEILHNLLKDGSSF
ncbi:unnamed protein product [Nezara viridula]|uniref:Uncharacterized protein n=1 Tax=Nezara viridula TaxID=85310 RepID=A0A9P0MQG4_NEZVI|nr:unnamed protein product [Nezara viridula]